MYSRAMASKSPATRWTKEHGYGYGHSKRRSLKIPKKVYASWWQARIKCWRLNRRYGDDMEVYSCYWGADVRDGETAEKHYHLGHPIKDDMWGY